MEIGMETATGSVKARWARLEAEDRERAAVEERGRRVEEVERAERVRLAVDRLGVNAGMWRDYAAWCADNGQEPLPVNEAIAVRYLLSRQAEAGDRHIWGLAAKAIGIVHDAGRYAPSVMTNKLPRALANELSRAAKSLRAFERTPKATASAALEQHADV